MALDLKLDIHTTSDCKNINIVENSGLYNSVSNYTGWGGENMSPLNKIIRIIIKSYIPVVVNSSGHKKTISPLMSVSSDNSTYTNFQTLNSVQNVKLIVPYSELYLSIYAAIESEWLSLGLTTAEKNYVMSNLEEWQTIEDHVYLVVGEVLDSDSVSLASTSKNKFNSVCNIEHKVNDMFTKIDLRCEDCDDEDIKDISLYNALLENLKNA